MGRAESFGSNNEFTSRQSESCRPGHPHEGGNAEHAENAGEVEEGLPEICGYSERQYQRRKGQQHVHAADHKGFKPAAKISGQHSKHTADRDPDHRRTKTDSERYLCTINET